MPKLNGAETTGKIVRHFSIRNNEITNTLYYFEKADPFWHCHENLNISFVLQGGTAETKKGLSHTEKGGNIFFYHSGEMHRWIAPNKLCKSINIEIEQDFFKKINSTEDIIKKSISTNIDAKGLILKMQKEVELNDDHSYINIQTLLLELISSSKTTFSHELPLWAIQLRALLHDHWNTQLSLNEMAQIVGVHPVTISKYFRKYFSCTLGAYQRKLKTNKSIELIKNSSLSLSEIAHVCGFSDQSHFIRNFKQQTNFLPKDFRRF